MADEAGAPSAGSFATRAPELRAAAGASCAALIGKARGGAVGGRGRGPRSTSGDRAGYALDGRLHIPEFAALWGGAGSSYFPAAALPAAQARDAAHLLSRRGAVLRAEGDGVFIDVEALRAPRRKRRVKAP